MSNNNHGFGDSGGGEFFNSWALWQKMTFVLGCGIFATIIVGFIKLFFDRQKLRKYSKVDKGKTNQTPEMLESQPVTQVTSETKEDIPFGIRAIQSGIEVDGVWISRTNTPVGSSRNSIISEKFGRSYNNSQLELPQTAYLAGSGPNSRPNSTFDRNMSTERVAESSRASSPGRGRTQQPRCANCNLGIRHSHIPQQQQHLDSPRSAPISGPPSPRHPPPVESAQPSGKTSRRTSDESDYMAITSDVRAYETAYIRQPSGLSPNSLLNPIDPRTDLDALATHRLSHVAETGQLTPRVRKPGHSGEWASVADGQSYMYNGVQYVQPTKTPSPPLPPVADDHEQSLSSRDPQSRGPIALSESYAPKAPYYPEIYQPKGPHHQYSYDEVPYEVNTEQNLERDSQVLRKVNAGFEIMRPGTFQVQTPEEQEAAERKQQKKLQKKNRRESSDSGARRQSAFTEEV